MTKTVKQQLLELGMKPEQIDSHCSDLYVLKNPISDKFVSEYQFKNIVTTFRSELNRIEAWYEIPFAYTEYYDERK